MSDIMTKWVVSQSHTVDANEELTDVVVGAWIEDTCNAYIERCQRLLEIRDSEGLSVVCQVGEFRASMLGHPDEVVSSASATELRPASFTIGVKLRPLGADATAILNVMCEVSLQDREGVARDLGDEIRDELIALAHAAEHYN
jgi:uncharacterized membrane protein